MPAAATVHTAPAPFVDTVTTRAPVVQMGPVLTISFFLNCKTMVCSRSKTELIPDACVLLCEVLHVSFRVEPSWKVTCMNMVPCTTVFHLSRLMRVGGWVGV